MNSSPPRSATASRIQRFLSLVERGGNALPHPATLFLILALLVVACSELAARLGIQATHPGTGEAIVPVSLLTVEGLHLVLTRTVSNFTGFAPLGTVLVALLGIGVAESSGLIGTAMRRFVLAAPRRLLTPMIVFAGIMSNVGSEIGYVLLIPLAGVIYQAMGRNPVLGLAAAFAGVSAGYSANLLLGTVDPLLAGLSQEAARLVDPELKVSPACNYYFMFVSTFLLTAVGTWVTERVVAPRLGESRSSQEGVEELRPLTTAEKRGLRAATATALLIGALLLWGAVPADGFLRDPESGDIWHSPLMSGIVTILFFGGALCGIAYGVAAGSIRKDTDVLKGMAKSMETLAGYLVLVFFAAQFVAYFNWTNLGLIFAVKGADALRASGLGGVPLMLVFIAFTSFINLFMGSASAKWALMAPIFVPMFLLLGYPPELTQAAYRVGDSSSNVISPMMSYFALIIAFFQRYVPHAGIGTLVATMLPYTAAFLVCWSALFMAWMLLGLPFGPG